MTYSEVFGGGSINPSQRTYLSLVTAVDVVLQWPIEQQIGGDNVAADIIDVNATAPGLNVDFSDARQVSDGFTSLMVNVGAQTVTIRDSAGGTIISLSPGEAWFIYLTDNATAAGVWSTFQLGATVSVANASALAGAGLKAIATSLNQTIPPTLTAITPINWADADRAQFTVWTGGVGILNLPVAGVVGSDWFSIVRNEGSGDLTLTPAAGTIDSAATLIMAPGTSAIVVTDGANFYTVGRGTSTAGVFDFVQIDVSGSGDFLLSGVQLNRIAYRFIGALTGNRNIVVPNTVQQYWIDNSTNGAFQLLTNTVAQVTPVEVLQNNRSIFYCDGTDVLDADTGTLTPPISIGQGGTGAVTAPLALASLGAVPITRLIDTDANSGLSGGGDFSVDRSHVVDVDNLQTELVVDKFADTIPFYDDSAVGTRKVPISFIAPETVVQLVTEAKSLDVVPTLSNTLFFNVALGVRYRFEFYIRYRAGAGGPGGLRFNFSGGTTGIGQSFYQYQWFAGLSNSGNFPVTLTNFFTDQLADVNLDGGVRHLWGNGVIFATTGGTFGFTWAQELSSAIDVEVAPPSNMVLTRLT